VEGERDVAIGEMPSRRLPVGHRPTSCITKGLRYLSARSIRWLAASFSSLWGVWEGDGCKSPVPSVAAPFQRLAKPWRGKGNEALDLGLGQPVLAVDEVDRYRVRLEVEQD